MSETVCYCHDGTRGNVQTHLNKNGTSMVMSRPVAAKSNGRTHLSKKSLNAHDVLPISVRCYHPFFYGSNDFFSRPLKKKPALVYILSSSLAHSYCILVYLPHSPSQSFVFDLGFLRQLVFK